MSTEARQRVVVLGAGVIGLSIALELHDRGYAPTIIARDLPDDSESVGFSSPWAGCNWFPFDTDGTAPTSRRERITFAGLAKLAESQPELCEKIPFYNLWMNKQEDPLWYADLVGKVAQLDGSVEKVPGNGRYAIQFESWILHAPGYTRYLGEEARRRGIGMVRKRVSSLDEAYALAAMENGAEVNEGGDAPGQVEMVINASGLGAKSLIGVQDPDVYAARGQTVLVHAPWCPKVCIMDTEWFTAVQKPEDREFPLPPPRLFSPVDEWLDEVGRGLMAAPNPEPAYIIPRPGKEGHFVLGGTYIRDNYSTLADLDTARRIVRDCFRLQPQLAPPGGSWEDIEVVSHNVGLRPARNGGPRVELEERQLSEGRGVGVGTAEGRKEGRRVGVVHSYGFGSAGFQQSLGAAQEAADLVDQYFHKQDEPSR